MSAVSIQGLSKTFRARPPVPALRSLSLEVEAGSLVAVLGPSGCGKSTLLRCIAGFERPDAGTIRVGSQTVVADGIHLPPERRSVGIVPQEGALFPHLDVAGNIAFGLRSAPRRERRARVAELLDLVGLVGFERRPVNELSGGQQQRVALARALAPGPDVVLLDEPFSALDAGLRASVRTEVADLLSATGTTAILVTHDRAEAFALADVVAVMQAGSIAQAAPPSDLYRRPMSLEVAQLVGEVNVLPGEARDGVVVCALGTFDLEVPDGSVTVLVRPEQVAVRSESLVKAVVTTAAYGGHELLVGLDVEGTVVTARWGPDQVAGPGSVVGVEVQGPVTAFPTRPAAVLRPPATVAADRKGRQASGHPEG